MGPGNLLRKLTGMKCQIASLKLPYKELKKNATVFQNYLLIMPLGWTFVLVKASLVWVDWTIWWVMTDPSMTMERRRYHWRILLYTMCRPIHSSNFRNVWLIVLIKSMMPEYLVLLTLIHRLFIQALIIAMFTTSCWNHANQKRNLSLMKVTQIYVTFWLKMDQSAR